MFNINLILGILYQYAHNETEALELYDKCQGPSLWSPSNYRVAHQVVVVRFRLSILSRSEPKRNFM